MWMSVKQARTTVTRYALPMVGGSTARADMDTLSVRMATPAMVSEPVRDGVGETPSV